MFFMAHGVNPSNSSKACMNVTHRPCEEKCVAISKTACIARAIPSCTSHAGLNKNESFTCGRASLWQVAAM